MARSVSKPTGTAWAFYGHWHDEGAEWEDLMDNLRYTLRAAFPSLWECSEWLGREDRAILENRLAYIGVSEYCGCVALWCVPMDHPEHGGVNPLAHRWAEQVEESAQALWKGMDEVTALVLMGRFSNGEALYQVA